MSKKIIILKSEPIVAFKVKVKCPYPECMDGESSYEWEAVVSKFDRRVECANCEAYFDVDVKALSE